jgi:hypothetical protein
LLKEILYHLVDKLASVKSHWQTALSEKRALLEHEIESCHSTSVNNSQPFSADEDGPESFTNKGEFLKSALFDRKAKIAEDLALLRHSTSLQNSQPFCADEDGPENISEDNKDSDYDDKSEELEQHDSKIDVEDEDTPVCCPFGEDCPSKKKTSFKNLELLRHHLNSKHPLELERIPSNFMARFLNLKKPRCICPVCNLIQPLRTP